MVQHAGSVRLRPCPRCDVGLVIRLSVPRFPISKMGMRVKSLRLLEMMGSE